MALVVVWGARVAWLALGLLAGGAVGDALSSHSRPVQLTGTVLAWIAWGGVAAALMVPSALALTIVRTCVPVGVVVTVALAVAGADATAVALFGACALVATFASASGELGQAFVQASAYGDERRFPLRPPVPYLVPTVVSWCVWCAALLSGPLLLAAGSLVVGSVVSALAVAMTWFLGRRYHRLSRRWLVLVPAGVVIHDHVVLAETAMFPRTTVAHLGLALTGTEAADLTGPAAGNVIEIAFTDLPTVVLAGTRTKPAGTALHARSVLVAPSRPGRALTAAAARLPVG